MYSVQTHVEKKRRCEWGVKDEEVRKNVFLVDLNSFMWVSMCSLKSSNIFRVFKRERDNNLPKQIRFRREWSVTINLFRMRFFHSGKKKVVVINPNLRAKTKLNTIFFFLFTISNITVQCPVNYFLELCATGVLLYVDTMFIYNFPELNSWSNEDFNCEYYEM